MRSNITNYNSNDGLPSKPTHYENEEGEYVEYPEEEYEPELED